MDKASDEETTALLAATRSGGGVVVKAPLKADVDANKALNTCFMPLQIAAQNNHLAVVKALLLGSGADIQSQNVWRWQHGADGSCDL